MIFLILRKKKRNVADGGINLLIYNTFQFSFFFLLCLMKLCYLISHLSHQIIVLCTYQCKSRGGGGRGGVRARGGDLMPGTIPTVGLLIVWSDPGVGTFDFDRQKPGINSEAVTKSVPRGFLKVTLLEKGMKFSFVLIAIIWYFKLSCKQIIFWGSFYLQVPIWL